MPRASTYCKDRKTTEDSKDCDVHVDGHLELAAPHVKTEVHLWPKEDFHGPNLPANIAKYKAGAQTLKSGHCDKASTDEDKSEGTTQSPVGVVYTDIRTLNRSTWSSKLVDWERFRFRRLRGISKNFATAADAAS
jgi:hypothetical protein